MIEEAVKHYFLSKKDVAAVYLFGSFAKGKERPMSDVDIGILLEPDRLNSKNDVMDTTLVQLGRILRKDIHPVILNDSNTVILKQIFKNGRPILIRNRKFHRAFKALAISRIADFNYYLQQMHNRITHRILEDS